MIPPPQTHNGNEVSVPPTVSCIEGRVCGYVYDPQMMIHSSVVHPHPEQPLRISEIYQTLVREGCISQMGEIKGRQVTQEEVLLTHTKLIWDKVEKIASITTEEIHLSSAYYDSMSLYVCPGTTLAARLSCGGVIEASLAVARGEYHKSFAIVRPPGHHAEPNESMGFCFYNNVAVAARVVQNSTSLKKIFILDWDVHHGNEFHKDKLSQRLIVAVGNGTHLAFNDDPSVLYISIHRYDGGRFYPGGALGGIEACGEGPGLGYSVNIPWPESGMGDADYLHAFHHIVMPIAMQFAPDLVMISAGFDAADGDQLGECHVTPGGYAHMTHMLCSLAAGRVVVVLEGGYNLDSISRSALAVAQTILGNAPPQLPPATVGVAATETVWQVAVEQSKYWKSIGPKACELGRDHPAETFPLNALQMLHRQELMWSKFDMSPVPVLKSEDSLGDYALNSSEFLDDKMVIVYIRESDKLRGELQPMSTKIELSSSYQIDLSHNIMSWIRSKGYGLLDIIVHPKSPIVPGDENLRDTTTFLWDNYVMLAEATQVILIGQESGCQSIMHLLAQRETDVMKCVRGIIQLVGGSTIPLTPRDSKIRDWYRENSQVYVSSEHAIITNGKVLKRHGNVIQLEASDYVKLVQLAVPRIQFFIQDRFSHKDSIVI